MSEEEKELSNEDIDQAEIMEVPEVSDDPMQVKMDFEAQNQIIAEALANSQPITNEQVREAKSIVDKLLIIVKAFNEDQLVKYCDEYQIDVKGVDYQHFDSSFLETSSARSYLIRQEKLVMAYLKWIDKCYELLSAFILLNTQDEEKGKSKADKKTGDIKKAELTVKLQELTFKRQKCEDVLFNVQGTREAVDAARDDLSRVLGYWQNKEHLNPGRSIQVDRKR